MSIATGGIDSQIQDKMDAYRSNPQALKKAAGVSKQTVDVMALQKLIAEKKEVAAAMQLEANQQPGTIAEQREKEAIEQIMGEQKRSLGELTQQTAGTLNTKAAAEKKGMNRLAKGAAKPKMGGGAGLAGLMGGGGRPPQRGPQAAGLPNARMVQAAQGGPVRRMAGGGIVGFSGGLGVSEQLGLQGVTQEQIEAFREKNKSYGLGGISDDAIRAILAGQSAPSSDTRKPDPLGLMMPKNQITEGTTTAEPAPEAKTGIAAIPYTGDPYAGDVLPKPKEGITQELNKVVPVVEPTSKLPETALSGDFLESTDIMGTVNDISSDVAFDKGLARSDANLKRDETNRSFEDMQAELAAFDAENYGKYEDINSFLIGTGGTGSIGAAAKGGKRAVDRSVKNRRNRLQEKFSLQKEKMSEDKDIGLAGQQLGMALAQEAAATERNLITNSTNMSIQDQRTAVQNAKLVSDENKAELLSVDKALDREVSKMNTANQTMLIKQNSALEIMNIISATRDALTLKEETNGAYAEDLAKAIDGFEKADSPKEKAGFEKIITEIQAKISLTVNTAMDAGISGNEFTMLEIESEAKKVFVNTLRAPTGGFVTNYVE
tara:strand:+ start:38 stop:1849 length:1812 start_codon:yes stop_codon:yes gene_type:complete